MAARTAADGKRVRRTAQTAADGVGATEWLEIMGAEKKPLVMSELGCADGCGRQMGGENCADGCGRRGCQGVAGNWWGEEAVNASSAHIESESSAHIANESSAHSETASSAHKERSSARIDAGNQPFRAR